VCHRAVDAQQLVAPAQLLALRVDQQHDGPTRVLGNGVQHHAGLRQRQRHADGRVAGGAHHGDGFSVQLCRALQQLALGGDAVVAAEERCGQGVPVGCHFAPRWLLGFSRA
jgi:hypothetical protein